MKKRFAMLVVVAAMTGACLFLGYMYRVPAAEKEQGLTGQFDVSADGIIAYTAYEKGKPTLYVKTENSRQIVQLPDDRSILDLAITPDAEAVYYIVSDEELGENSTSTLFKSDLGSGQSEEVFTVPDIITELMADPKSPDHLFYLQAEKFSGYSPGASLFPYDFDIHRYDMQSGRRERLTDMSQQSMSSLQVSGDENAVYVQMDEEEGMAADGELSVKGRIFKIPIDRPDRKLIISIPEDTSDLYDFVLVPDRAELIYQAIAGTGEDGMLEYELFSYNWDTQEIRQLTRLHAYAGSPIQGADGAVYFMVDRAFGEMYSDQALFRMEPDGTALEEMSLDRK
ncbi:MULTISPECIES: hypothetical protein [Sporosarcina]|uniref:hypothetical protein n=1 Tax=Sporosarcina TaxID=1569 RepID=UPI000590DFD7|nr:MULTISPECIES: hypothetical protein [Sporosarcina]WJY27610.1 hypothetical protein QWT68_00910 [Sporosarcina sp. 0.2-SM1T-5]